VEAIKVIREKYFQKEDQEKVKKMKSKKEKIKKKQKSR
jgi:hypothetical protein